MPKATDKTDKQTVIEGEVVSVLELHQELESVEAELMQFEPFQKFMALRKAIDSKLKEVRKDIAEVMIPAYVAGEVDKTLKRDWGSITVTESDEFTVEIKDLPKDYKKSVPVMSMIKDFYHLHGKPPKGAEYTGKKYGITLRIKGVE